MNWVLLQLVLAAWPPPPDAGREAWADPSNWPNEPAWTAQWPLLSFTPDAGWATLSAAERSGGVGMSLDRAFSLTRGTPAITIAIVAREFDTADQLVAGAWRLNTAELPDAGDGNGNGRIDVGDFGVTTLAELTSRFSNGVDDDLNGRVDDLAGWDFDRAAPVTSAADAGLVVRTLAAPLDDGLPGVGACPGCVVLPFVDARLERALSAATSAGARIVLVDGWEGELTPAILWALDAGVLVVTSGTGTQVSFPLATHPAVLSPRTLTLAADGTSARSRVGCGGTARGTTSVSTTSCEMEAAATLAGVAGLMLSVRSDLTPQQVRGLMGGERLDAFEAVRAAAAMVPATTLPAASGVASTTAPLSPAARCALDGVELACDAGVETNGRGYSFFTETSPPFEWTTSIAAPPVAARRGLISLSNPAWGSLAPRYVDFTGLETDELLVARAPTRLPLAVGRVDGDRQLDVVELTERGVLTVNGGVVEVLDGGEPIGGPVLFAADDGTALITVERSGRVSYRLGTTLAWTSELGARPLSGPAVGRIDRDRSVDLAIADGQLVHVLLTDSRGPTAASWTAPSRAREALLADLTGDAALEVIAEKVFDARGAELATLDRWAPSPWPAVLTRVDESSARSLFQLEPRGDGQVDLARYDLARALAEGDRLVARQVVITLNHLPAPGGMAAADVTGERRPDLLIPTVDGLLFIVDANGGAPAESPLAAWGTVLAAPTVGVRDDQVEFSVRTTRGDVARFLARGLVADITWDGPAHDEGNTRNAETPFHARRISGLGVTDPPILRPCGCGGTSALMVLATLCLARRRSRQ